MKYKIFVLFFLVSFSLGSCKKYLEVDPKNQRPLTTVNDVKLVLAGYLKVIKPERQPRFTLRWETLCLFNPATGACLNIIQII
jgi:hypothetical protein